MPRELRIVESKSSTISLTAEQAHSLNRLGRQLASKLIWWGARTNDDELAEKPDSTVIRCSPAGPGEWNVLVSDAVGIVAVDDIQILVEPKIPTAHLIYLLEASGHVPRLGDTTAVLDPDDSFWELVARWYVTALEDLLRSDLLRDYRPALDTLSVVRGRIDICRTTTNLLAGRAAVTCEYEEFDHDTPLNRVLLAAARTVAASPLLSTPVRRRALRLTTRMDTITDLQPGDLHSVLDRRSIHYREPLTLAAHVLNGHGRALEHGAAPARSFLFRTPELVEDGIRTLLAEALAERWHIVKKGLQLGTTNLTANPDLVFNDGLATGDVKYKITRNDWSRPDLYQAVAFATAYGSQQACVISFARKASDALTPVPWRSVRVANLNWPTDEQNPANAGAQLVQQVDEWLAQLLTSPAEPHA